MMHIKRGIGMMAAKNMEKDNILTVCKKLKKLGLIKDIEEHKYSIQILIRCDEEFQEDSYLVRNMIKLNFEKQGYTVDIKGTYWLNIIFVDVIQRIDDCFNEGDVE